MRDLEAPSTRRGRVEDHCCIDASVLRKSGKLELGASGVWSWSRGTSIVGAVNLASQCRRHRHRWLRRHRHRDRAGAGDDPDRPRPGKVRQSTLRARLGGVSTFLLCPGCGSRRRKLYIVAARCRCRGCHRLGFAVETKSSADRAFHKAAKARAKLGAAPGPACRVPQRYVPSVPRRGGRGAGRRKYGHLVRQIAEADRAALRGIMAAADRLASSM